MAKQLKWDDLKPLSSPQTNSLRWDDLKSAEESTGKKILRTSVQPALGAVEGTAPGLAASAWQLLGMGEVLDPEEIEHIKKVSEREGVPFDEEKYMEAAGNALKYVPTVSNIAREIEERTGVPLEPKEWYQKALRLAGLGSKISPGNIQQKAVGGAVAGASSQGLQAAGIPEVLADPIALGIGGLSAKTPKPQMPFSIAKETKPSGLPTRRYESTKKPKELSAARHKIINEKVEADFKNISDKILSESPTYKDIRENPIQYAEKLNQGFENLEKSAADLPIKITKNTLQNFMKKRLKDSVQNTKGITLSESESAFKREFGKLIKRVSNADKQFSLPQSIEQFRKNNQELATYFEPGKSKGFNKGKRDALLEYNKALEDVYETILPDSQFLSLFKEQNKQWGHLKDYEFVQEQISKPFGKEKIEFKEIAKLLDKRNENLRRPFIRLLGKENFKNFEGLIKDFMSIQKPYSLLKRAESAGFRDLIKLAGKYVLSPELAKLSAGWEIAKNALKMLLDKPTLIIVWKDAIDDLKAGRFAIAEKGFYELENELKESPK